MIEAVVPEEFHRSASEVDDGRQFCGHQIPQDHVRTLEMGFTEEQLKDIGEHDDAGLEDPEVLARHEDGVARGLDARGYQGAGP